MKKVLLISLCIPLLFSCETTPEEAKKDMIKGCVAEANINPGYIGISKDKIQKYCECAADEVVDNSGFSVKELEEMKESDEKFNDIVMDAALNCIDILLE